MYYTYILKCTDETLYTGITTDIGRRIKQHNGVLRGWARYTSQRQPVELVYSEEKDNRSEASKREHEIKKLSKTQKLELISRKKCNL